MQQQILNSLSNFLPEATIVITLIACLVLDLILKRKSVSVSILAITGLIVSFYFVTQQTGLKESLFCDMIVIDPYSLFFKYLFIVSTIFVIIFAESSKEIKKSVHTNEHVTLILALTLGAFLMASSINLLMMYLSLETVSIASYILAGYTKNVKRSSEASMKYVIYGAASSGIMLYAMSMLYGFTGSMNIFEISSFLAQTDSSNPVVIVSIIMVTAGFGYKISSVPFHFWTPDVYEGAPIPITTFLAVTSSAAGFAVMIRFFNITFLESFQLGLNGSWQIIGSIKWTEIIAVLSVASMVIGNFVAIWQTSLKRLLAYSSIAHSGYLMLGLVVANQMGLAAMLIYLFAYMFMNLGAFYVVIMISNKLNTDEIESMQGLAYRSPFVCAAMGIFMFSLSGIPATVGFIGKFYIFAALINSDMIWLAIIAMLNSVVSLFFYVKVLKVMYLKKPLDDAESKISYSFGYNLVLILLAVPTILFGLYFAPILKFAESSVAMFGIN
ncbi:MAG: NADH-quinone oxidoreductase subunit N [Ignavibacteria bacterium]|nr:NADH-quinone oxidoreductase subunit N [Ignavibacteria bacterium]